MKLLSPLALLTLCSVLATPLMADEEAPGLTGCAAKKQGIINQIELAKSHANLDQQAGLEKAMKKGDSEKINKRKDKLAESRKELQQALDELDK